MSWGSFTNFPRTRLAASASSKLPRVSLLPTTRHQVDGDAMQGSAAIDSFFGTAAALLSSTSICLAVARGPVNSILGPNGLSSGGEGLTLFCLV